MNERAGTLALDTDLIDVDELVNAYYELEPDVSVPAQRVAFGTSGHRGSSLNTSFNLNHIAATTQAIVEYRADTGVDSGEGSSHRAIVESSSPFSAYCARRWGGLSPSGAARRG